MRLHKLMFVVGLTFATLALGACQSTSQPVRQASGSGSASDTDIEKLTALLKEYSESEGAGAQLEYSDFEKRKANLGEKLSTHLLKSCIVAGAQLSDFVGTNLPRCAYEGMSKLVDPSGEVGSHCDGASNKDAYVECAGNGLIIMRMKRYLNKEMVAADWSGKEAPVDKVADALASRLTTVCLGEHSGSIGNCLVDKMASIFEVPNKDADFCKGGGSVKTKVECMGYAAALALFEPRLS